MQASASDLGEFVYAHIYTRLHMCIMYKDIDLVGIQTTI